MREKILSAAMQLANLQTYRRLTRAAIAAKAGVAPGLVSYHFGDMKGLRDAVVAHAVETKALKIVGQAIAENHPVAKAASKVLRAAAVKAIASL